MTRLRIIPWFYTHPCVRVRASASLCMCICIFVYIQSHKYNYVFIIGIVSIYVSLVGLHRYLEIHPIGLTFNVAGVGVLGVKKNKIT